MIPASSIELKTLQKAYPTLLADLAINWTSSSSGCEARADLVGDYLAETLHCESEKIWVRPRRKDYLEIYLNASRTSLVQWNYHVANLVKLSSGEHYIIDPTLFSLPVNMSDWKGRFLRDNKNNCQFMISSRLAYRPPYSYEGDSSARHEFLRDRDNVIANMNDLSAFTILSDHLEYLGANYIDELEVKSPKKWQLFMDNRLVNQQFGFYWHVTYPSGQFLELMKSQGFYLDQPFKAIAAQFDLNDIKLQYYLKLEFWPRAIPLFEKSSQIYQVLNALSRTDNIATEFKGIIKDPKNYELWFSPFGAPLWNRFAA